MRRRFVRVWSGVLRDCSLLFFSFLFLYMFLFLARIGGDALAVRRSNVMDWSYTLLQLDVDCQNGTRLVYADLLAGCIL